MSVNGVSGINGYDDLNIFFQKIDKDRNMRASSEELSKEGINDVKSLDKDGSGTVEIWEFMQAVNEQRKTEIFTEIEIEDHKLAYEYSKDPEVKGLIKIYGAALVFEAIYDCVKADFVKKETIDFLIVIARAAGIRAHEAYKALPAMIDPLQKAGLKKEETINFLKAVAWAVGGYTYDMAKAYKALPAVIDSLQKAGLKKDEIIDLFKAVEPVGRHTNEVYESLPAMIKAGVKKKEIIDLLKAVDRAANWYFYRFFEPIVCGGSEDDYDWLRGRQEIIEAASRVGQKSISTAYQALPAMLEAGVKKEETIDLLKAVARAAGWHTPEAYESLPAMIKAGLKKEEIIDLLKKRYSKL